MKKLEQDWRRFKRDDPGQRFKNRYLQKRQSSHSLLRRVLVTGAGLLLVAAGIFFLPAPGPGLLIVIAGAGLLAQQSLWIARVLDWAELRIRAACAWGARKWRRASLALKAVLVCAAAMLFAGLALAGYQLGFAA